MKKVKSVIAITAFVVGMAGLLGSSVASAADRYWMDSAGNPWKGSFGECVRTPYWTEDGYTPGCDPEPVVEEEEVVVVAAPEPVITQVSLSAETLFDFDKATLRPDGVEIINDIASKAQGATQIEQVYVAGYTDSTGPEEYNKKLSERRADAVKAQLVEAGIPEDKITTQGFGEEDPIASNDTSEGRQKNRRAVVEVVVLESE